MTQDTTATPQAKVLDRRTRLLLEGPIVATLLRMAAPNILVMVAQASTGLIETYFVARLGTDALAGMALVFPFVMLMQMISSGAMGGGISSAIARALGAGRRDDADALVLHALIIQVALGAAFSVIMLAFGSPIYRALGGNNEWRIKWFNRITYVFITDIWRQTVDNLRNDGTLWQWSTWRSAAGFLFGKRGLVRQVYPAWRAYKREDFHPSQQESELSRQWLAQNSQAYTPVTQREPVAA